MDNPVPGFIVNGEVIERTGVDTFQIERGNFTTCRCPPETERRPWEIEAKEADVEVGGYAVGKDLWFKVFDVPVLYVPWLIFPVKTERQSGLPDPVVHPVEPQRHRDRAAVLLGGARQREPDADTGVDQPARQAGTTLEYVNGETGDGKGGGFGPAQRQEGDGTAPTFFSDNRWAYWLRHQQALFSGRRVRRRRRRDQRQRLRVRLPRPARQRHPAPAHGRVGGLGDRRAHGSATRGALVSVNNDIQNPNDLDRDGFFLQRLPDLRARALPRSFFGIPLRPGSRPATRTSSQFSAHATACRRCRVGRAGERPVLRHRRGRALHLRRARRPTARSARRTTTVDDATTPRRCTRTEGDGVFEEGELLADSGNRLDFFPKLVAAARSSGSSRRSPRAGCARRSTSRTSPPTRRARSSPRAATCAPASGARYAIGTLPLEHIIEPRIAFAARVRAEPDRQPAVHPGAGEGRAAADRRRHPAGRRRSDRPREGRVAPAAPARQPALRPVAPTRARPRAATASSRSAAATTSTRRRSRGCSRCSTSTRRSEIDVDSTAAGIPRSTTSRTCARRSAGSPRKATSSASATTTTATRVRSSRASSRAATSSTRATRATDKVNQIDLATYIVATAGWSCSPRASARSRRRLERRPDRRGAHLDLQVLGPADRVRAGRAHERHARQGAVPPDGAGRSLRASDARPAQAAAAAQRRVLRASPASRRPFDESRDAVRKSRAMKAVSPWSARTSRASDSWLLVRAPSRSSARS